MVAPPTLPPPPRAQLARSTALAAALGAVVLVLAVLPAEYGIDPTGFGRLAGFTKISDARDPPGPAAAAPGPRAVHSVAAAWTLSEVPVGSWEGYNGAATTSRVRAALNLTNVTSVTATLRWEDDNLSRGARSAPDELEVSMRAPDGRASQLVAMPNGPDGRGEVNVTLALRPVPFPAAEGANVTFAVGPPDPAGQGEWTFVVRLYGAGSWGPGDPAVDHGNRWNLTVTAQVFGLEVRSGEGGRDVATIALRPQEDVEYKFHMAEGARLDYAWRSTLPVYSDFHGDTEAAPDDFVRYREATLDADEGSLTAGFEGRHGWYWRNRGAEPLTITLETRGDYRILGVV